VPVSSLIILTLVPLHTTTYRSNKFALVTVRLFAFRYLQQWHKWYWGLLPILAVAAYATVLRIGFLADDYFQLYEAQQSGIDPLAVIAAYQGGFLRPAGLLFSYQIGWALWGLNPLPYHLVSLLAHASSSLLLGLWLSMVTAKPRLGWLAGALFAVFPLHTEAVGWVAAQFDNFSVLLTFGSLCCFTYWWINPTFRGRLRIGLYLASWLLYGLAVFTKESVFTFVPVFALSAYISSRPIGHNQLRRLSIGSLLLVLPIVANLVIRLTKTGSIGGYTGAKSNYADFIWDYSGVYLRALLSPINEAVFGTAFVQLVGLATTIGLLVGLVLLGREQRWLLLLMSTWIVLALVPVLNLARSIDDFQQGMLPIVLLNISSGADNLQQNRYLYLSSAGFLSGVAVLIHSAINATRRFRSTLICLTTVLLVMYICVCWIQLRPWHTATVQVNELEEHLLRAIPPQSHTHGMTWYVDHIPFRFKGVPLLQSGLGLSRLLMGGDYPQIERTSDASTVPLFRDAADAFALRFGFHEETNRFVLTYGAGITNESERPALSGTHFSHWDFTMCDKASIDAWQPVETIKTCRSSEGLVLTPNGSDPQLILENISLPPVTEPNDLIRVRVLVRYDAIPESIELRNELFWKGNDENFNEQHRRTLSIKQDGRYHTYWTFLTAQDISKGINSLRFDPINSNMTSTVRWITIDVVN
jgi:hypothetical protein